ncbi:MAG: hypothetical protein EYC70_16695 [Planctomycetota bacterium]|nr:MAG: hypothetical protein EYC70_16695 [Planctomycetota bacterium]
MSPLAALIADTAAPLVLAAAVLCEWWAVWFALGRNFSTTLKMTLVANGASLALGLLVRASGALGDAAAPGPAPAHSWLAAWLLLLAANLAVECGVLSLLMRRRRPSWRWNRYDLAVYAAANACSISLAAVHRWLA